MSIGDKPINPIGRETFNDSSLPVGITYREWLSGLAMQGVILNSCEADFNDAYQAVAKQSIKLADALIAELEKSNGNS